MSGLHDHSKAPRHRRRRQWPPTLCAEIRWLRDVFPNLGKDKLYVLLEPWCERRGLDLPQCEHDRALDRRCTGQDMSCPDAVDAERKGQAPAPIPLQTNAWVKASARTTRVTAPRSTRWYALSGAPAATCSRPPTTPAALPNCFILALCLGDRGTPPRQRARRALRGVGQNRVSGRIEQILTDNGSEFQGAFADYARAQRWRHCHTYPRSPKMNPENEHCQRAFQPHRAGRFR